MDRDPNPQLLFAKKEDVLESIKQIYESLIDITQEVDKLHEMLRSVERNQHELTLHVSHLRSIIAKDLTIRGSSPHMLTTTLRDLKMSQKQWSIYINSAASPNDNDRDERSDYSSSSQRPRVRMIETENQHSTRANSPAAGEDNNKRPPVEK